MRNARVCHLGLLAAVALAFAGCSTVSQRAVPAIPVVPAHPFAPVAAAVSLPLTLSTATPAPSATPAEPAAAEPDPAAEPEEAVSPDCRQLKCVALTLDDGPAPGTAKLLDLFAARNVTATFFVLGENAAAHPALVRRMAREGHEVGNHSWTHPEFWYLSKRLIRKELTKTNTTLARLGVSTALVRPPYGEWDADVAGATRALGMQTVLWDVDPQDWKDRNPQTVARRVLRGVKPGSIVLTHDTIASTRKAYPAIISGLRKRGYTFVTVSELLGSTVRAGKRSFRA